MDQSTAASNKHDNWAQCNALEISWPQDGEATRNRQWTLRPSRAEPSLPLAGLLTLACVSSAQLTLCLQWKTEQKIGPWGLFQ